MTFNCADSFSGDYREARTRFREQAAAAKGALDSVTNPVLGPDGGDLTADIAWFGPRAADRVLVMVSGTHGVEGFCGSGAQSHWLARGEAARLGSGVAVLMIHAINPYGFAWLRRVTEDNVDLNRNWIDFTAAPPRNPGYDALSDAVCPAEWTDEAQARSAEQIAAFAKQHGPAALQQAVSGGQYRHPFGIFFGGTAPTWSRRTQTAIFADYLAHAGRVAIIDYHTGLGPWGYGEQIVTEHRDSPAFHRASAWYGSAITSTLDGSSSSAQIAGDGLNAALHLLSHAEVTGMALEVGTQSLAQVLGALRADAWLHAHGDPESAQGRVIKSQVRDAYYGDADDWKGMVAAQSMVVCRQALAGLTR